MNESMFPPGTPVCVRQTIIKRGENIVSETVGVVESWDENPTGSWFVHGKNDRLQLKRLTLRKVDNELTSIVIDDATSIAKIEAAAPKG